MRNCWVFVGFLPKKKIKKRSVKLHGDCYIFRMLNLIYCRGGAVESNYVIFFSDMTFCY